ncbi:MAG: DUF6252 family protein, partial [Sphingobacteriaceae bacterium]
KTKIMKTTQNFKKGLTLFVLALYITLSGMQCEKDKNIPEIDKLPPPTQTGAYTFGCLVDGKAFMPRKSGWFSGPVLQGQYQYLTQNGQTGNYFAITASDQKTYANEIRGVSITAQCVNLETKTYPLDEYHTLFKLAGEYHILDESLKFNTFTTDLINKGELTITRFDDVNQIISGTFWFDAVNKDGVKVEVREGRFDVHFIK